MGPIRPLLDRDRLLRRLGQLSAVGGDAGGGVTRIAWSPEAVRAVNLVSRWAAQAGARVNLDGAGNLIAETPGTGPGLPPLVTGSHLDSVVRAGPLDGAYGVVAGVEILAALAAAGTALRHPLRVLAYANEEGIVSPAFTGSRAITGELYEDELSWEGPDGLDLAARLASAGCDPAGPGAAAWEGPVAASVELHIEQGPVLDSAAVPIGVVTAIIGQRRGQITVTGVANHAGTTPMSMRHDALAAAAEVVLAVRRLATDGPAEVATVGRLTVSPGVANVIPGEVTLSYDVRAADDGLIEAAVSRLRSDVAPVAASTGTGIEVKDLAATPAAATDPALREVVAGVAARLGLEHMAMVSGAGHDSAYMAKLGPMAMIFVPSTGGVSHNPAERTEPGQLADGAEVLLATLLRLDEELDA